MPFVFDCSIAMAWCFEDEASDATDALLDRLGDDPAVVPNLFHLEVANVLAGALRARKPRITPAQRAQFLALMTAARITVDDRTQAQAWNATLDLADRHALSAYDAAYLELALRLRLELATLDADLRKAALAEGVTVLP